MRSLIWEMVRSIIASEAKKRFFLFAPYLPFQRYLGCYQEAFEAGVVLGYTFRNRLALFAKLFTEPGHEQEVTESIQEIARERLAEAGAKDFFDLAEFAEEARIETLWLESGIYKANIEFAKKRYKMPLNEAAEGLYVAISTGIGFGSGFPELTEQLFKVRDERPIDREEWAKWRKVGVVAGDEPPEPLTLGRRQAYVLSLVELFVSKARPELLSQFKTGN